MPFKTLALASLLVVSIVAPAAEKPVTPQKLVIYTSSKEPFIKPIFEAYTKATGVQIDFVSDGGPVLIERLKAEGPKTPADLFMTVDVGNLWLATEAGLLGSFKSPTIEAGIPAPFRDPQNRWIGLSMRARTIFYNPSLVKSEELSSYENLSDAKWSKKLCLRTSKNVYNQSLVASLIEHRGDKKTEEIVKGWVKNLATDVFPDDTSLLKAIDAGQCAIGIANTYYFGRLVAENKRNWNIKIFWPNQSGAQADGRGTHVNVMGGGVVASSKHKEQAVKFLEWATQAEAQQMFASKSYEFPLNPAAKKDALVAAWGDFKADAMPLFKAGVHQKNAVKLMDRVGFR